MILIMKPEGKKYIHENMDKNPLMTIPHNPAQVKILVNYFECL